MTMSPFRSKGKRDTASITIIMVIIGNPSTAVGRSLCTPLGLMRFTVSNSNSGVQICSLPIADVIFYALLALPCETAPAVVERMTCSKRT